MEKDGKDDWFMYIVQRLCVLTKIRELWTQHDSAIVCWPVKGWIMQNHNDGVNCETAVRCSKIFTRLYIDNSL